MDCRFQGFIIVVRKVAATRKSHNAFVLRYLRAIQCKDTDIVCTANITILQLVPLIWNDRSAPYFDLTFDLELALRLYAICTLISHQ